METSTQAVASVPGVYTWQIPGKSPAVQLNLEVIDSLLPAVMRAFGAVPKRGAEVGGLLIGTVEQVEGGQTVVRVEQAEVVPCVYAKGPSYLLTDEDQAAFDQIRAKWRPDPSRPLCAVGYFRSHTRDGLSLSHEDIELLNRHFPDLAHIALLIRPFATKPVQAGFFFRENDAFPEETPLPFIFSRRELGDVPARRQVEARQGESGQIETGSGQIVPAEPVVAESVLPEPPPVQPAAVEPQAVETISRQVPHPHQGGPRRVVPVADEISPSEPVAGQPIAEPAVAGDAKPRRTTGWVWVPLSFALLLIGAVAGFLVPKYLQVPFLATTPDEFSLGLTVSQNDDSLTVHWNSDAHAIRAARGGVLEIEDDGYSKPVDLDSAHLQTGSIVYRNTSPSVRFRLTVQENGRTSVSETADWSR